VIDSIERKTPMRTSGLMMREYDVVIEQDTEGYYVAWVPGIVGCHTQARSLDDLMERVKEAIEVSLESEDAARSGPTLRFVGVQRLSIDI
jgi:predicted RNase H-like HicB family nuclease